MVSRTKKIAAQIAVSAILALKTLFLVPRGCCRFTPTCTEFVKTAIEQLPLTTAIPLVFMRLFRCHPFARGGYDPVPETATMKRGFDRE
jgi:hypothetical protein